MTTPKGYPPNCPPGYDAQQQGLWCQLQHQMVRAGKLEDRCRVLDGLVAGLARDLRELRWVMEHILSHTGTPHPDLAEFADHGVPATNGGVPAAPPADAPPRRKKGGAA